jgi:hypothetical protein
MAESTNCEFATDKLSWNSPSGEPNTKAFEPSVDRRFRIGASRPFGSKGMRRSPRPWRVHRDLTWAEDAWNGFDEVLANHSRQRSGASRRARA